MTPELLGALKWKIEEPGQGFLPLCPCFATTLEGIAQPSMALPGLTRCVILIAAFGPVASSVVWAQMV